MNSGPQMEEKNGQDDGVHGRPNRGEGKYTNS